MDYQEYKVRKKEFFASRSWKVIQAYTTLSRSISAWIDNSWELYHFLNDPKSDTVLRCKLIADFFDSEECEKHITKAYQLMLNYTSSMMAFREHSRNVFKAILEEDTERFSCYEEKVRECFGRDLRGKFLQDFRNMILHKGMHSIGYSFSMKGKDSSIRFHFDSAALLRVYKNWTKESKEFIEASGERIDIEEVVSEYTRSVERFYIWAENMKKEWFVEEAAEFERLSKPIMDYERANQSLEVTPLADASSAPQL